MADNPVLEYALRYASRGWNVLILHGIRNGHCTCRRPACKQPGKHPLTWRGLLDATCDPDVIRLWFKHRAWANLGIACGVSGLAVADVDERKGGPDSLRRLGTDTRAAGKVRTGGGWHLYFLGRVPSSVGQLGSGLDVRSLGGYAVAPPSRHASGAIYAWVRMPNQFPPWPFPDEPVVREAPTQPVIEEGQRNDRLFRLAGSLHWHAIPGDLLLDMLHLANQRACKPPLQDDEVRDIARKILQRPRRGSTLQRQNAQGRAGGPARPAAAASS